MLKTYILVRFTNAFFLCHYLLSSKLSIGLRRFLLIQRICCCIRSSVKKDMQFQVQPRVIIYIIRVNFSLHTLSRATSENSERLKTYYHYAVHGVKFQQAQILCYKFGLLYYHLAILTRSRRVHTLCNFCKFYNGSETFWSSRNCLPLNGRM